MAYVPESIGQRVPPELGYLNIFGQRPSLVAPAQSELAVMQGSRDLRDIERQIQRMRATAERALAASRALDPRFAPITADLAATLQEAQQVELRLQSARSLLESSAALPQMPTELGPQPPIPAIPTAAETQAAAIWAAAVHRMARTPPVEIRDTGKELVVHFELPGIDKENVEVQARDTSLYVHADREREEREGEQVVATERLVTRFERRIALPEHVVPSKASASFRDGVLEVTLPKKHPGEPPQKVNVK